MGHQPGAASSQDLPWGSLHAWSHLRQRDLPTPYFPRPLSSCDTARSPMVSQPSHLHVAL